jgi:catechol 2,3-dioxygenase-like lactoylglutathione lyase family enzyme
MITVSASVDVPALEEGLRFYRAAFGFEKVSEPYPGVAVLRTDGAQILLLARDSGTCPCPARETKRQYSRHWTPVHIDFHVDDFQSVLAGALAAGAKQEQLHASPGRPSVAFCSDPFGHGFCIIEDRQK